MSNAPHYSIDLAQFNADPYPDLAKMRERCPICYVPELDAVLLTKRDDIATQEKRTEIFSSVQPDGLMVRLMGENMMRKDGEAHALERKATFPTFSPRTVRDHWLARFRKSTQDILDRLEPRGQADLVRDFAMPVAGEALRTITGLSNMTAQEIDRTSQGMIDGISNYSGDKTVERNCRECTDFIDASIDAIMPKLRDAPDMSLLSVQMQAGLPMESIRANVKLAISGGQNEPRDAIAGTAWALLYNPDQLEATQVTENGFQSAFEEYARWISPIGMTPRRVAQEVDVNGIKLAPEDRVFLMYSSGNRDADIFANPDDFDINRNTTGSLAFGAGPHFCAGAATSRALIADIALPMLFDRLPNLRLIDDVQFSGWAFRGPVNVSVSWDK